MKNIISVLLILVLNFSSLNFLFCQSTNTVNKIDLQGKILEQETNQALGYVSIGILNKSVGTISDSSGNYHLTVSNENLSDTIQISIVGYVTKKFSVTDFIQLTDKNIRLLRKYALLPDVVVSDKKFLSEIIGRQEANKFLQVELHNPKAPELTIGSEMGMKMKNKKMGALLKDLNWYISANNFNSIKFRVNVYSIKNDLPDTLLSNREIFGVLDNHKTGWIKFDLEPYNIKVNGDFIITIQWVDSKIDKKEKPVTLIPVSLTFSKNCYYRIASQDKWGKKGINMSYYVTLWY